MIELGGIHDRGSKDDDAGSIFEGASARFFLTRITALTHTMHATTTPKINPTAAQMRHAKAVVAYEMTVKSIAQKLTRLVSFGS